MKKGCCVAVIIMLVMTIILPGCAPAGKTGSITITAQDATESYILTSMARDLLEQAGYRVNEEAGMKAVDARAALLTGKVDACIDYTGTAWLRYLKQTERIQDPAALFAKVQEKDLAANGIDWVDCMTGINSTPAVVVPKKVAQLMGTRISDLIDYQIKTSEQALNFSIPSDEYDEDVPGGFRRMMKWYIMTTTMALFVQPCDTTRVIADGLEFTDSLSAKKDPVPVAGILPRTEPCIQKYGLVILKDDKKFYSVCTPAFCIRKEVLARYPGIADVLRPLTTTLTQQDMITLNYRAEIDGLAPREVAAQYLKNKGLIR